MSLCAVIGGIVATPSVATGESPISQNVVVYDASARAQFVIIGNSLGLAGALNENGPGTSDSIHTFTSVDGGLTDSLPPNPGNPWSGGTTHDWSLDSSAALLALPTGASVLRAHLIWGGSYRYVDDVSAYLDNDIAFTTPLEAATVSPDPLTAVTLDLITGGGSPVAYYLRSADVTALVSAGGGGSYAVGSVPGTQNELINTANAAGWTLVVVVADEAWSCRTLQLGVSGAWVDETGSSTVTVSSIETPATGTVDGRLVTGAIDGDANRTGDGVEIQDPGSPAFISLSGPNNPETNFFASQINTRDGLLETSGTWGTANHDAASSTNTAGGRQGWDHTGVPLGTGDGTLGNGQTTVSIRFATTGDSYVVTFFGLEADTHPASCVVPAIFSDGFEIGTTGAWSVTVP